MPSLGNWRKVVLFLIRSQTMRGSEESPRNRKLICQDKDEEGQMHAMDISSLRPLWWTVSTRKWGNRGKTFTYDPIRLFGLIRAQKENLHSLDYDLAWWTGSYWHVCRKKWRPIWHSMTCHGDDLIACQDGRYLFIQRVMVCTPNGIPYKLAI